MMLPEPEVEDEEIEAEAEEWAVGAVDVAEEAEDVVDLEEAVEEDLGGDDEHVILFCSSSPAVVGRGNDPLLLSVCVFG